MSREVFANLAETTLASGYTSGGASMTVTSASGFPSTGTFRIRLGNAGQTIYRVDSIAGAVFTGGAEFNDANATAGDSVKIVASRAVAERFTQSPEAGEARLISGVAAVDFYGPAYKLTPVVAANFAWLNQGGATVTDASGVSYLQVGAQTQNLRARVRTAPATPYTVTALVASEFENLLNQEVGIGFHEIGTGKSQALRLTSDWLVCVTNSTALNAIGSNQFSTGRFFSPWWMRIRDDGTNLIFSHSADGINFRQLVSDLRTAQFTTAPDRIMYYVNERSNAQPCGMSVLSWLES